jgi:threonine/homoserine/homoserine lactone efflux protein
VSIEFLVTSMILVLIPGTGVLYTLAIGLGGGFKASLAAAMGCTLGIVPSAAASIIGLAAVFHTSALAFQLAKMLGVIYLLYKAWNIMRDGGAMDVDEDRRPVSLLRTAVNGTLLKVLNPKLSLFFLAFLPQFVDGGTPDATSSMLMLAAVFMLLTFVVFSIYGGFAALARDYVISSPVVMTWLKHSFAATFAFLGLKLALAER